MNSDTDLRELLDAWPYDPDDDLRIATGRDGRPLLQVRTPLGLEQIEVDGRPDGTQPHGVESELVFQESRWEAARTAGTEVEFELDADACAALFAEGVLYYQRYVRLFQLKDWPRTLRDTGRNLRAFDFVHRHAARSEDRQQLEKWRPYVIRMNGAAAALQALDQEAHDRALGFVQTTIERIQALPELDEPIFDFERVRSVEVLKELRRQIQRARPVPATERLERQLAQAIKRQEFERAAQLRDQLRALRGEPAGSRPTSAPPIPQPLPPTN
jgi:hypothetical protein